MKATPLEGEKGCKNTSKSWYKCKKNFRRWATQLNYICKISGTNYYLKSLRLNTLMTFTLKSDDNHSAFLLHSIRYSLWFPYLIWSFLSKSKLTTKIEWIISPVFSILYYCLFFAHDSVALLKIGERGPFVWGCTEFSRIYSALTSSSGCTFHVW